jgi:phage shock protein PspC (stress-responsive transcriptional regulator)
MNKTININLGGYAFIIDEDAFETANNYLSTLTSHFGGSDSAAEIMQDIESRMGELISRTKGTRTIVSKADVVEAIAVLGTPEELKDMDFTEPVKEKKAKISDFRIKTGKRLYRDADSKVIGGVCSGLSSYFGIQDPIWMRIAFALSTFLGGAGALIYIVIWAIVPAAKTISERLEMMGEPTNVNNIARMAKEEFEELSDKLKDKFGKKNKGYHGWGKHHYKKEDTDFTMKYGQSWDFREREKAKMEVPYTPKDFV